MNGFDKEATIKRSGDLMLSGWRMMAMLCPICSTALMSKGDSECRCPGCDLPVMTEASAASSGMTATQPSQAAIDEYESEAKEYTSLEEMKKEYDLNNKRRDEISGKLGERMLKGWTLLNASCDNESCNGTPLVGKISDSSISECVCCETVYKDGKATNAEFSSVDTANKGAAPKAISKAKASPSLPASPERTHSRSHSDITGEGRLDLSDAPILNLATMAGANDPSSLIAAKLTVGWALLDKCCQELSCSAAVPLVRDREGVEHCVVCEAGAIESETPAPNTKTSTRTSTRGRGRQEVENDDDEDDDEDEDFEDDEAYNTYVKSRLSGIREDANKNTNTKQTKTLTQTKTRTRTQAQGGVDSESEESEVIFALRKKMRETAQTLTEPAMGVEACTRAAELVAKLAIAIKAVSEI